MSPIAEEHPSSSSSAATIATAENDRVQVKFIHSLQSVEHPPIYIPTTLRRYALSEIVNHLIGNTDQGKYRYNAYIYVCIDFDGLSD